ncbi:MAG TPA: hypothetical protein VNZ22_10885 [Bacillota bacterium]|nr:hypothetical protein [Bacillota bacterium]
MKVCLRHIETKLYYAGKEQWVEEPAMAMGFHSMDEALRLYHVDGLRDMEMVVQHSAPGLKVVLPLGISEHVPQQARKYL